MASSIHRGELGISGNDNVNCLFLIDLVKVEVSEVYNLLQSLWGKACEITNSGKFPNSEERMATKW